LKSLKLAIVNKGQDLLRINPIKVGDSVDFKISTLGNEYTLNYWSLGREGPERHHTNQEITYHSSVDTGGHRLDGVVHVKDLKLVEYSYSFPRVVDLRIDTEFPIPLLKLSVANGCDRPYVAKNNHILFDLGDGSISPINTVEIYITSKEFGEGSMHKWPFFSGIWIASTIDYLVHGPELSSQFKRMMDSDSPKCNMTILTGFKEFNLHLRHYYDDGVNENMLSFYENYDYMSIIASTRVQLIDGMTKAPLSGTHPAFVFDLERQKEQGISKYEIDKWYRFFRKSHDRINRLKIHRMGFLVPQYSE
jgi:hypothetical protein